MARKRDEDDQPGPKPLNYRTWVLKVYIHCQGCNKKVKKILQGVEGVYVTIVDAQQHKVTVTGNVDAQTLLNKLKRSGKHADLWPDMPVIHNSSQISEIKEKQSNPKDRHTKNPAPKTLKSPENGDSASVDKENKRNKNKELRGNSRNDFLDGDSMAISSVQHTYPTVGSHPRQADVPVNGVTYNRAETPSYPTQYSYYTAPVVYTDAYVSSNVRLPPYDPISAIGDDYDYDNGSGCAIM